MAHRNLNPAYEPKCDRCRVLYDKTRDLVGHCQHAINHHLCPKCDNLKDFERLADYIDHVRTYHLICPYCEFQAPSDVGLRQHCLNKHFECLECKSTFRSAHENNGHCQSSRPPSVECFGCGTMFSSMAAVFNHLESSACSSGIARHHVEELAYKFLAARDVKTLHCPACFKNFNKVCDMMQHAETSKCSDGYWKGPGGVGMLVQTVKDNLVEMLKSGEFKKTAGEQDENNDQDAAVDSPTVYQDAQESQASGQTEGQKIGEGSGSGAAP
ncbi:hypothetical protein FQN54_008668 [Arachnomyces sp. PD_36]|nr:hypothetical protein FQN54_008668 [Arachnomyces sp. PD_36]